MNLTPNLDNGGRWYRFASEHDITQAMKDKNADVIECPVISMTFVCSRRYLTIVRAGALGGDVNNIEGGWIYPNDIAYLIERNELRQVAEVTRS